MKLRRTITYGLQATLQLAQERSEEPVSCRQLAAKGKMPERYLLQILRKLVTRGILRSTRGVDGGYSLGRRAGQISLLDVIEAIDGPVNPEVTQPEGISEEFYDRLNSQLKRVTSTTREQLKAIKLSHLIKPPKC